MKITLVLVLFGLCMLPIREAFANNALSNALKISAQNTGFLLSNSNRDLKVKSRQQATSMVKSRYKAKVISVSSSKVNGNPGYKAKLLGNDGTVFYVYVDAKSGQMRRR